MTKNRQRIDWLVLSMFLNLNYNQFNQTDPDGIEIFFWVKTLANFWRCQLFPKINTIVIYCLSLTILKVSFNQVCFFIVPCKYWCCTDKLLLHMIQLLSHQIPNMYYSQQWSSHNWVKLKIEDDMIGAHCPIDTFQDFLIT